VEEFEGKVAVITGGASGIGLALARQAASLGMKLVLGDVEAPALDAAVAELEEQTEVVGVRCDVSSYEDVVALGDAALESFDAVHLAVNNAGVAGGGLSWEIDLADWEWVLGVDLWGVIHGVRVFTPLVIAAGGGHIVNTASMAGLTSPPFMAPYNVAKHGVVTLSETMQQELSMTHPEVGVTVVCPGWVRTRINRSTRNRPGAPEGSEGALLPDGPAAGAAGGAESMAGVVDGLIERGLDPADVAALVFEAVREGRVSVLTHPDWIAGVTGRAERLVAGEPPQLMLPGLE
jgi:NAD(P)-dependent dehydrogenase (short-subunit alcohol dehydrogenase family)